MIFENLENIRQTLATRSVHNGSMMEMATTLKVLEVVSPMRHHPGIVAVGA